MIGQWLRLPDGTVVHLLMDRPRRKRCRFCPPGRANFATLQCDFEVAPGKTCDEFMCSGCAKPVGEELDHCPIHTGGR